MQNDNRKPQTAWEEEMLEKLAVLRSCVEKGIVTPDEYIKMKASYEICARESRAIREYEEKYGLVDDLSIDDGLALETKDDTKEI